VQFRFVHPGLNLSYAVLIRAFFKTLVYILLL
jgi:hypothetical protein